MKLISLREHPDFLERAIVYFQDKWPSVMPEIYDDCLRHSIDAKNHLPQWYLLLLEDKIIGCAGLITNDFISRGDLYPWLCALFIDEKHRGQRLSSLLIDRAKADTKSFGYAHLYLSTEHIGLYEKVGFKFIGEGYHPWNESSRIYEIEV
jgi:N-acetylglutamate synthase-like GNAT family acetyltransferase